LTTLLTDYMGPVAPIVCDDCLAACGTPLTAEALSTAIARMAQEIGSASEAQSFSLQARQRLKL
jgi:hypothetical protein